MSAKKEHEEPADVESPEEFAMLMAKWAIEREAETLRQRDLRDREVAALERIAVALEYANTMYAHVHDVQP